MVRFAFVHPSLGLKGGAENLVVWLAGALAGCGHEVMVATRDVAREHWTERELSRFRIETLPALDEAIRHRSRVGSETARALGRLAGAADAVVAFNRPAPLVATEARRLGALAAPIVWYCNEPSRKVFWQHTERSATRFFGDAPPAARRGPLWEAWSRAARKRRGWLHRLDAWRRARVERRVAAAVDGILAISAYTAESLRRATGLSSEVCWAGVPLPIEALAPAPASQPAGDPYVLVVSSGHPQKNLANVLEAAGNLTRKMNSAPIFRVVGRGTERPEFRAIAERAGAAAAVRFEGAVDDAALDRLYSGARLLAYLTIDEPFGLVPIEALARGVPVVVSDHGGPAEIVAHGRTGLHANPFLPEAIAAAIEELWRDPDRARALGEAGRQDVHDRFTIERFAERFEAATLRSRPAFSPSRPSA